MIKCLLPLLLFCLPTFAARPPLGGILQTDDVSEIEALVDEGTLVVIEVEDALFEPVQALGSETWAEDLIRKRSVEGPTEWEARVELTPLWNQILQKTEVRWVDPTLQGLVRSLQRGHVAVMGLTWKDPDLSLAIGEHLKRVDVRLERTAPFRGVLMVSPSAKMVDGVLYVGVYNFPGATLIQAIDLIGAPPPRLVFVSHRQERIEEILSAAQQRGIPTFGVRFSAADGRAGDFKPEIAALQLRYFKKILPDEAAKALLPRSLFRPFGG